jgi:hypothetical protein
VFCWNLTTFMMVYCVCARTGTLRETAEGGGGEGLSLSLSLSPISVLLYHSPVLRFESAACWVKLGEYLICSLWLGCCNALALLYVTRYCLLHFQQQCYQPVLSIPFRLQTETFSQFSFRRAHTNVLKYTRCSPPAEKQWMVSLFTVLFKFCAVDCSSWNVQTV